MRVFNLEIILVALIVLMILIGWLFTTWGAFQKSLALSCPMSSLFSAEAVANLR
jgi:hypothetical protein